MATEVDPVCHMDVDVSNPPGGESRRQGTTYYFCAPGCKVAFDRDPEKYLQGPTAPAGKRKPFLTRLFGRGA